MAHSSASSKVDHIIGDSKRLADEPSRDLGRFFGVSDDKMTQNMTEYQVVCFSSDEILLTRLYI